MRFPASFLGDVWKKCHEIFFSFALNFFCDQEQSVSKIIVDSKSYFHTFPMLGVTLARFGLTFVYILSRLSSRTSILRLWPPNHEWKESASHHMKRKHNTMRKHTLKIESALLSALLAFTGVNFHVNFHVLRVSHFRKAGTVLKSLFLTKTMFLNGFQLGNFI